MPNVCVIKERNIFYFKNLYIMPETQWIVMAVLGLAVAFIIGAAATTLVQALVNDIISL